jgi:hypothetical protein
VYRSYESQKKNEQAPLIQLNVPRVRGCADRYRASAILKPRCGFNFECNDQFIERLTSCANIGRSWKAEMRRQDSWRPYATGECWSRRILAIRGGYPSINFLYTPELIETFRLAAMRLYLGRRRPSHIFIRIIASVPDRDSQRGMQMG